MAPPFVVVYPASQSLHLNCFLTSIKKPGMHFSHSSEELRGLMKPIGQNKQSCSGCSVLISRNSFLPLNVPFGQTTPQIVLPFLLTRPGGQYVHFEAPVCICAKPKGQFLQLIFSLLLGKCGYLRLVPQNVVTVVIVVLELELLARARCLSISNLLNETSLNLPGGHC